MDQKLKQLYQQMYELTEPECRTQCRVPQSCCSPEYCDMALQNARANGITLKRTGHPKLPLMSATGCTVEPWLRPLCTLHTCAVNGQGLKVGDPVWTKKYFKLRDEIEEAEWRRVQDC